MTIQSYRDLEVWKKAITLVKHIYKVTQSFPKHETYGLTSQLRRCAVSVPSNIAEGRARDSTKEFLRFIQIAYGSLAEVETQLIIAQELEYMENESVVFLLKQTADIGKMLNGLTTSLKSKLIPDPRPQAPDPLEEVL